MHHGQKQPESDHVVAERNRILAAFRTCFNSDAGRIVLTTLRASAGCGKPSFLPPAGGGTIDPFAAAFRDGRKSILDEIAGHLAVPEDAGPPTNPQGTR